MENYNWLPRLLNYQVKTGFDSGLYIAPDGRLYGTWIMGNNYRVKSGYYGGYPAGYLRRMRELFPEFERERVLHLFSGAVDLKIFPGETVDINETTHPDYIDDAQTLRKVPVEKFRIVFADPPYSVEDAEHYKTTMIKRNVVMRSLGERLKRGALIVWLDQVLPMYRKKDFRIIGCIGMVKSTNHRFRVITIFEKV